MKLIILSLILGPLLTGCLAQSDKASSLVESSKASAKSLSGASGSFSIMTFNVENLFDTEHDSGKVDYTYLPLANKKSKKHIKGCRKIKRKKWRNQCLYLDWSESVLTQKLERLSAVIKQVKDGLGPDIIVFQEIENIKVLNRLREKHLKGLGYKDPILVEGGDVRGIDMAFLAKFEAVGQPKLHKIPFKGMSRKRKDDTRGILQQDFKLPNGGQVTGFAVHFPAPYHPYEYRIQAYKHLRTLKQKLSKDAFVFAAGDFNTPKKEEKRHKIFKKYVQEDWLVTQKMGCSGCLGTNYYPPKKSWSFLDMILLSTNFNNENSPYKFKAVSVANKIKEQVTSRGYPKSFRVKDGKVEGVSDHWPVVVEVGY